VIWSFSAGRSFERCSRRWFYRQVVAHHAAKDPFRHEAYLLSKLGSLWSWRGRLVDDVITRHAIPSLSIGRDPDLTTLLTAARDTYEAQLAFAQAHRLRETDMRPGQHPDFLALLEIERGTSPQEADLVKTWKDIEAALANLVAMEALLERLKAATLLVPQRALTYKRDLPEGESVTVRAIPDLLAFFQDAPPLIVDWKVHTYATADYREQLTGYALALVRADGQWGLPKLGRLRAINIELLEVQLLTNELRHYDLTDENITQVDASGAESATTMQTLLRGRAKNDRNPHTVPATTDLKTCNGCGFKVQCWAGAAQPQYDAPLTLF